MSELTPIELNTDNGIVKFTLAPPAASPQIGQALINNTQFPDGAFTNGKTIPLGAIGIAAAGDFKLDKIAFEVKGQILAGLGVYRSTEELFQTLKNEGLDEPMVKKINFPDADKKNLVALRWGYAAEAEVTGKLPNVAFGAGVNFGASGRTQGLYAVLRSFDRKNGAFDSIAETVKSWKMPRQITSPGKLHPGTWIISEIDGALRLSLGVDYGYEYSWARESIKIGDLSGDLALKIQANVAAKLGFTASGRYALVVSRQDASETLRLQIYKLKQKGWSFAFDAAVDAQAPKIPLPEDFYELVKGVFNLNGLQALKDIEKWLETEDPATLLGEELVGAVIELVEKISGVKPDDIDAAIAKLKAPIERWRALPHEIAGVIYELMKKAAPVELDRLRAFLDKAIELSAPGGAEAEFKRFVAVFLDDFAFFETAVGKWLTAAAEGKILSLLADFETRRARFRDWAARTRAVLDGEKIEDALTELQKWIEEKLNLDKIIDLATKADFDALDSWLKKRVSDFLGKTAAFEEMKKIRDAVKRFLDTNEIEKFYDKIYRALTEKYQAELHYAFQKTTTRTALLDLTFDFAADDAGAERFLKLALAGDFTELLSGNNAVGGVRLNQAELTHNINRHSHLEVALPFLKRTFDHINESVAEGSIIEEAGGRIWIFNLAATDTVKKNNYISKLAVAANLSKTPGVRIFGTAENQYAYQLLFVKQRAEGDDLRKRLKILSEKYFPAEFADGGRSFDKYLAALDRALEEKGVTGEDEFGSVLAAFNLALPGTALTAWQKAPSEKKDRKYFSISRRVQEILRNWIPLIHIYDLEQYKELVEVYPLLVYSALPVINKLQRSGDDYKLVYGGSLYEWDYQDKNARNYLMNNFCRQNLPPILKRVREQLKAGNMNQSRYEDGQIGNIIRDAQRNNAHAFVSLVKREDAIITGITKTAKAFNDFRQAEKFDKAAEALAAFGAEISDTFNDDIGGAYSGENLRPLGSLLMLEIAGILDKELIDDLVPSAMLELSILNSQSKFKLRDFLDRKRPPASDIALHQTIVRIA